MTPDLRPPPYRVARALLPNGLRVVTVEAPHLHTASVVVYVRAGARYEDGKSNGLSHFVEHMLFRGSAKFPTSYDLNLAIERLGGTLYAETGRDYSLFQIALSARDVAPGLEIMGDLFTAPTFRDIDLERKIIVEEILEDLDDRGRNVNVDDIARAAAWERHPLGYTITGPLRNVKRFTVRDVRRHFQRFYRARNMVLCVGGPVRHADVLRVARRAFGALAPGRRATATAPLNGSGPRFHWVRNDSAQTQVQILFHALPERDPGYLALAALMRVLDDGMSTRLHYRICDQQGLAYHVAGAIEPLHDTALLEIDAACVQNKLPQLVGESLSILGGFASELVSEAELDKAKRRYRRDLEASYDDLDGLCGWFGGTELFFPPKPQAERLRRMEAIDPEQIRHVARRVLRPERLTVAVVGALKRPVARRVEAMVRDWR